MKRRDNPYIKSIEVGGIFFKLLGIATGESLAFYMVGELHGKGFKAYVEPKRIGFWGFLFEPKYCVWVEDRYEDEEKWAYKPIKNFPYYEPIPLGAIELK